LKTALYAFIDDPFARRRGLFRLWSKYVAAARPIRVCYPLDHDLFDRVGIALNGDLLEVDPLAAGRGRCARADVAHDGIDVGSDENEAEMFRSQESLGDGVI
jgi:hypothetical protein